MTLPTVEDMNNMTDEEMAALRKKIIRSGLKALAIHVGVTALVVGATIFIAKKLENASIEED